jgi:flagellar hook assembly protein FlgD
MIDRDGEFKYSNEKSVTILSGDANVTISEIEPNPVQTASSFDINLAAATSVTINVYDMAGSLVKTLHNSTMNAGSNNIQVNATDFTSGVYNVVITIDNQSFMKKMNVVK